MSQQDDWLLPEGIYEFLPGEAKRIEGLRRKILNLLKSWGYSLVIPPIIDFLDSLLTATGHELDLQTFKLTDQISGRLLGIRADMTPQVARIDAHNTKNDVPTRLCYIGTVLHTWGDHLEKSRSPIQLGAELYGHEGLASDLEILRLMLEVLAYAGIADVHLDLGHVGIFRGLAKQAELDSYQESELFDVLQRKSVPELNELTAGLSISESLRFMLWNLIELNGDFSVIGEAKKILKSADRSVISAIDHLEQVAVALSSRFPSLPINFDLAELRGYHYHTGLVFAAFIPGYGRELTRGGRYDEIGAKFGRARAAVGFSADLKALADWSSLNESSEENSDSIFAPEDLDQNLDDKIRDLRIAGRIVLQALPGQHGGAMEMGCRFRLEKQVNGWEIVAI